MNPLILWGAVLTLVAFWLTTWKWWLLLALRFAAGVIHRRSSTRAPAVVQHRRGGFLIKDLHVSLSELLHQPPSLHLPTISIASLYVKGFLHVRICGLKVQVHLQRVPKAASERQRWGPAELRKLQTFENSLWGPRTGRQRLARLAWLAWLVARLFMWVPSWNQCRTWATRHVIAFVLGCVHLELKDVTIIHIQEGEPGPYAVLEPANCRDALSLTIRNAALQPFTPRKDSGTALCKASAAPAAAQPALQQQQGSQKLPLPRRTTGNGLASTKEVSPGDVDSPFTTGDPVDTSRTPLFKRPQGTPSTPGGSEALASTVQSPPDSNAGHRVLGKLFSRFSPHRLGDPRADVPTPLQQVASLPRGSVAARGALASTASGPGSQLLVAGVSIALLTKSLLPRDEFQSDTAAGADTAGTNTPSKVRINRRNTYLVSRLRRMLQQQTPAAPTTAIAAQPKTQSSKQKQQKPVAEEDSWDATYTILQQWGLEAVLSLLPQAPAEAAAAPNAGAMPLAVCLTYAPTADRPSSHSASAADSPACPGASSSGSSTHSSSGDVPGRGGTGGIHLHAGIHLKALVPQVTPAALVVGLKLTDRAVNFFKYAQYWRRRPLVSVKRSPVAWWQHACKCVLSECRRRYPIRSFKAVLATQSEYMLLYCAQMYNKTIHREYAAHYNKSGPDLHTNNLRLRAKALREMYGKAYVAEQLKHLEYKLTLGQAMVYRSMVALRYSKYFVRHPDSYYRVVSVLDMLAIFAHALPFVNDNARGQGAAGFTMSLSCPRLGVQLLTAPTAAAVAPAAPAGTSAAPSSSTAAAATPGPSAAVSADSSAGTPQGQQVVVLGIEGLDLAITPDHKLQLKASTILLSTGYVLLGDPGAACEGPLDANFTSLLCLPAPQEHLEAFGPKMDLSGYRAAQGLAGRQQAAVAVAGGSPPGAGRGAAPQSGGYPVDSAPLDLSVVDPTKEASVARHFASLHVLLAPVEVSLTAHGTETPPVTYGLEFIQALQVCKASGQCTSGPLLSGSKNSSLTRIVMDSYRGKTPVPSSMNAFAPRIQVDCPQILLRYELDPEASSFSVQGMNLDGTAMHACLSLSKVQFGLRYTSTAYGLLCHQATVHANLEGGFQVQPVKGAPSQRTELKGQHVKLWLRTSDTDLLYPGSTLHSESGAARPGHVQSWMRTSRVSRSLGGFFSNKPRPDLDASSSYPFFPLFMAQHVLAVAVTHVPYEPVILGQATTHVSANTFGVLAWFSPWQAELVAALIASFAVDPYLQLRTHTRPAPSPACAGQQQATAASSSSNPAATAAAASQGASSRPSRPHAGPRATAPPSTERPSTSRLSLLVDVPMLTVMCYAKRTVSQGGQSKDPSSSLLPPRWVQIATADRARSALPMWDPVVTLGEQLAPLLGVHVAEFNVGARIADGDKHVRANLGNLMVNNFQLQTRSLQVWSDNSSEPFMLRFSPTTPSLHGCMLGPLNNRALAGIGFVRNRRRAMHAINLGAMVARPGEKPFKQLWRRPLETYLLMKATDFAFFLLTRRTVFGPQKCSSSWQWYRRILKEAQEEARTEELRAHADINSTMLDMLIDLKEINERNVVLWTTGSVRTAATEGLRALSEGLGPDLLPRTVSTFSTRPPATSLSTPLRASFSTVVRRLLDSASASPISDTLRMPSHIPGPTAPAQVNMAVTPAVIEDQLSFCRVYSQTRAGARTAFPDPNVKFSFSSRHSRSAAVTPNMGGATTTPGLLSPPPAAAATVVHNVVGINVGYLTASVAMYSTLQIIRLIKASQQALVAAINKKPRPARPPAPAPPRPARRASNRDSTFALEVNIVGVRAQIIVEEGPGGRTDDAATHLTSLMLLETNLSARQVAATDTQPAGLKLTASVHHVCVRDLQAAIEHSRVVAFALPGSVREPSPARHKPSSSAPASTEPHSAVKVTCLFPSSKGCPPTIAIVLTSPRIMFQLRYVMSMLYAIQVLLGNAGVGHVPHPPRPHTPLPPLPHKAGPIIIIQASDVQVVLPGGCAFKKGPIKRAMFKEALMVKLKEVQFVMPGFFEAISEEALISSLVAVLGELEEQERVKIHKWLTSEGEIEKLMCRSERLVKQHSASSHRSPPRQEEQTQAEAAARAQAAEAATARQAARAGRPTSRWDKLTRIADRHIVKPIKNLLGEAERMATTTERVEHGTVVMRMDLDVEERNEWQPQEQLAFFPVDGPQPTGTTAPASVAAWEAAPRPSHDAAGASGGAMHTTMAIERQASLQPGGGTLPTGDGGVGDGDMGAAQGEVLGMERDDPYLHPMFLLHIEELSAHSCHVEAGAVSEGNIVEAINDLHSENPDRLVEAIRVRKAMADWQVCDMDKLLHESNVHGVFMNNPRLAAMQLHFSFINTMSALMGPDSYQDILKMAIGNMAAGTRTYFSKVTHMGIKRVFNTVLTQHPAFAPNPHEVPFFSLTIDWLELRGTFKNDPAWWDPDLVHPLPSVKSDAPVPEQHVDGTSMSLRPVSHKCHPLPPEVPKRAAEPFIRASLVRSGLTLLMMKDTGNMHLGFQCQGLRISDVRTRAKHNHQTSSAPATAGGATSAAAPETVPPPEPSQLRQQMASMARSQGVASNRSGVRMSTIDDGTGQEEAEEGDGEVAEERHKYEAIVTSNEWHPAEPEVTLVHSNTTLVHEESAHLHSGGDSASVAHHSDAGDNDNCVKVLFSMLADGTMACEVEFDRTLLAWPYLTEMSLVNAIVSIFVQTWCQGPGPPEQPYNTNIWPCFYFNLVMKNSQVLLPVLSAHIPSDAQQQDGSKPDLSWPNLYQLFQAVLAQSKLKTEGAHDTGLVLTMSAFRFGYFYGGDGDSILQVDLRNTAGFVRLQGACVTNFLLPIKGMALSWVNQCPKYEEAQRLIKTLRAQQLARRVKERMLAYARAKAAAQARAEHDMLHRSDSQDTSLTLSQRPAQTSDPLSDLQRKGTGGIGTAGKAPLKPWEQLLALAMERANNLLRDRNMKTSTDPGHKLQQGPLLERATWRSTLRLELEVCAFRAAFSHVPLWQLLSSDLGLMSAHMTQGRGPGMFPLAKHMMTRERIAEVLARPTNLLDQEYYFRRRIQKYEVLLRRVSALVCNDKPNSFGAPDMLQACIDKMSASLLNDFMYFGHKPQQTGQVEAVFTVNYLNNSTSSWDVLMEPWQVKLLLSNPVNKIFKENRTTYVSVESTEPLRMLFHPAALLTVGDTLALVKSMSKPALAPGHVMARAAANSVSFGERFRHSIILSGVGGLAEAALKPHSDVPPVEEQMGLSIPVTRRVPQRYLILNQTGMVLWYWRPTPDNSNRVVDACKLIPSRKIQELKVQPLHKQCTMVGPDGVAITQMRTAVINLKFEGNWMPLIDVSTDVVGKYCYYLDMPLEKRRVPLIVDVALMGRNKVIKLHSALFVQNSTTMDLHFLLHLPLANLAQQILRRPQEQLLNSHQIRLPALKPGEGTYLPVVACLDGVLFLEPVGCRATEHDVIRLFPSVSALTQQQGYICCKQLPTSSARGPPQVLRFTSKVHVKSRVDWRQGTHHEVEVWYPGKFVKATQPLEATIKIKPTVVLTNSLPYSMQAYVVAIRERVETFAPLEVQAAVAAASGHDSATGYDTTEPNTPLHPHPTLATPGSPRGNRTSAFVTAFGRAPPANDLGDSSPLASGAANIAEEQARLDALEDFDTLANKLHKRPLGPTAAGTGSWEVKRTLVTLLRSELRWACPRLKSNDLLFRADIDKDNAAAWEKVPWTDVHRTILWLLSNLSVTEIDPGSSSSFYVQLTETVCVSLKVPRLGLQSYRPCPINEFLVDKGNPEEGAAQPRQSLKMGKMAGSWSEAQSAWDKGISGLDQELDTKARNEEERRQAEATRLAFELTAQGMMPTPAPVQPSRFARFSIFGRAPAPEPTPKQLTDNRLVAVELRVEPASTPKLSPVVSGLVEGADRSTGRPSFQPGHSAHLRTASQLRRMAMAAPTEERVRLHVYVRPDPPGIQAASRGDSGAGALGGSHSPAHARKRRGLRWFSEVSHNWDNPSNNAESGALGPSTATTSLPHPAMRQQSTAPIAHAPDMPLVRMVLHTDDDDTERPVRLMLIPSGTAAALHTQSGLTDVGSASGKRDGPRWKGLRKVLKSMSIISAPSASRLASVSTLTPGTIPSSGPSAMALPPALQPAEHPAFSTGASNSVSSASPALLPVRVAAPTDSAGKSVSRVVFATTPRAGSSLRPGGGPFDPEAPPSPTVSSPARARTPFAASTTGPPPWAGVATEATAGPNGTPTSHQGTPMTPQTQGISVGYRSSGGDTSSTLTLPVPSIVVQQLAAGDAASQMHSGVSIGLHPSPFPQLPLSQRARTASPRTSIHARTGSPARPGQPSRHAVQEQPAGRSPRERTEAPPVRGLSGLQRGVTSPSVSATSSATAIVHANVSPGMFASAGDDEFTETSPEPYSARGTRDSDPPLRHSLTMRRSITHEESPQAGSPAHATAGTSPALAADGSGPHSHGTSPRVRLPPSPFIPTSALALRRSRYSPEIEPITASQQLSGITELPSVSLGPHDSPLVGEDKEVGMRSGEEEEEEEEGRTSRLTGRAMLRPFGQATQAVLGEVFSTAGTITDGISQLGGKLHSTGARVGEGLKSTGHRVGGGILTTGARVGEGIKTTGHKVGEGIKSTSQRVATGIKTTSVRVGENIKDTGVKVLDSGLETAGTGTRYFQLGVTKLVAKAGARGGDHEWGMPFSQEGEQELQDLATESKLSPHTLWLGLDLSLSSARTCRVSIYSHFWIDNRTGFDLVFRDLDVPFSCYALAPLLLYHQVRAPGLMRDKAQFRMLHAHQESSVDMTDAARMTSVNSLSDELPTASRAFTSMASMLGGGPVTVSLLNEQRGVAFRIVDKAGDSGWCNTFSIDTAGQKLDISLKGKLVKLANSSLRRMTSLTTGGLGSAADLASHASATPHLSELPHGTLTESHPHLLQQVFSPLESKPQNLVQRMYNLAVEIWPGPDDTVFSKTKVLTIKNKYIMLNDTGLTIEFKQKDTPNPRPGEAYGVSQRFAGQLPTGARAAIHWDNAFLKQQLVIRPAEGGWCWSGSFELKEKEEYFGLRIRPGVRGGLNKIIPVNITVGSAGQVLVTLKSERSVPPYLIVNRCREVVIKLKQQGGKQRTLAAGAWSQWDEVQPGATEPFAWDKPNEEHKVQVVAYAENFNIHDQEEELAPLASLIDLDDIKGRIKPLDVHQDVIKGGRRGAEEDEGIRSASNRVQHMPIRPDSVMTQGLTEAQRMQRLARELMHSYAKKVHVSIYAEGPTRILCFSEDKINAASSDDEDSLPNLEVRLQQLKVKMKEVESELGKTVGVMERGITSAEQLAASLTPKFQQQAQPNRPGTPSGGASLHGGMMAPGVSSVSTSGLPVQPQRTSRTSPLGPSLRHASSANTLSALPTIPGGKTPDHCSPSDHLDPRTNSETAPVHSQASSMTSRHTSILSQPPPQPWSSASGSSLPRGVGSIVSLPPLQPLPALEESQSLGSRGSDPPGPSKALTFAPATTMSSLGSRYFPATLRAVRTPTLQAYAQQGVSLNAYPAGVESAIGGDLSVRINGLQGLAKRLAGTHAYAEVAVTAHNNQPSTIVPISADGTLLLDYTTTFRGVAASDELRVEFWTLAIGMPAGGKGTNSATLRNARREFLGCVEIPLQETLTGAGGQPRTLDDAITRPLKRRTGGQLIRGQADLAICWQFTSEGLLMREVQQLELMLAKKVEIVARMKPVPSELAVQWLQVPEPPSEQSKTAAAAEAAAHTVRAGATSDLLAAGDLGRETAKMVETESGVMSALNAQQISDIHYVNLDVSVQEVTGLRIEGNWRKDVLKRIAGGGMGWQITGNDLRGLPHVLVTVSCMGNEQGLLAQEPNLEPRFRQENLSFKNVALTNTVTIKVWDQKDKLVRSTRELLGEAVLTVGAIPSTSPVYVWVPLWQPRPKWMARYRKAVRAARKHGESLSDFNPFSSDGLSGCLKVFLRLQISKPPTKGVKMGLTLDLAGVGLCAKSSVYELLNFTLQNVRLSMLQTTRDLQLALAVNSFQLDNQLLETLSPVVLSAHNLPSTEGQAVVRFNHQKLLDMIKSENGPLLSLQVVRSHSAESSGHHAGEGELSMSAAGHTHDPNEKPVTVISFKQLEFDLGPLDLMTDQKFLEAVYMFVQTLPWADLRQDETWQKAMESEVQGYPSHMSLASGGMDPSADRDSAPRALAPLGWLSNKEEQELRMMLEQSSSWFFIETLHIGALSINITLAITSNFETGNNRKKTKKEQRTVLRGVITRLAGSTGFQLIDVTDAPVNLAGKTWTSLLVNRVGLSSLLTRHYSWLAMAEARKLLGGAGPAIASVPLNLIWAGINIAELGRDLVMKRIDTTAAPAKFAYVVLTASGQIVRFFSQGLGWLLSVFSVPRDDWLSDSEMLRRFKRRPQNAMDALSLFHKDISIGILSAIAGIILDPYMGARQEGYGWAMVGFLAGCVKAVVGAPLRPAAGLVHAMSDMLQGLGLACLGKQGIQGKLLRRVMAPGTPMHSSLDRPDGLKLEDTSGIEEDTTARMKAQLLGAWQASLPYIAPELDGDRVLDVIAARRSRVVLLTNKHMAYLRAFRHQAGSSGQPTTTYRLKWFLRNSLVDNIRGVERSFRISIKYRKTIKGLMLELPLHKGMRTKDAEAHQNLIYRLNRHIREDHDGNMQAGNQATVGQEDDLDLTIAVPPPNIVRRLY